MPQYYNPPPTYADPVLKQGEHWAFNPIWLKWFVDLAGQLGGFDEGNDVVFCAKVTKTVPAAVATTMFSVESGPAEIYLIGAAAVGSGDLIHYAATSIMIVENTTSTLIWSAGGPSIAITVSGLDIKVTLAAGPLPVNLTITKIG